MKRAEMALSRAVLVPVVDPTADVDPSRDFERSAELAECLMAEGWSVDQVGEWARVLTTLSAHVLSIGLSARGN